MKNLMYLSVVALMMSCGTTEETEIVVETDTEETVVEETVVEDTAVEETFDVSGVENVRDLLDTLETIEPVVNE